MHEKKRSARGAHVLTALLAGALTFAVALPAEAGGVNLGNLRSFVLAILDDVGLVDSSGTNAAALGPSSSVDSYVSVFSGTSGKLLDDRPVTVSSTGQLSWPTGLGSMVQLRGPSDQDLAVEAQTGRGIAFRTGGAGKWNMQSDGVLRPTSDGAYDIGTSSLKVRSIYAAGGTVPSVLHKSVTSAQTGANTDETTLWSYSLPAGTLASDGQAVRITVFGTTAANANNKTMVVRFGSTALKSYTGGTSGAYWRFQAVVMRTGATTQLSDTTGMYAATTGTYTQTTPAETLANAVTISMTGRNGTANAGDIAFKGAIVEFLP